MKYAVRIAALAFVLVAAFTSASPSKTQTLAGNVHSFGPPGPTPTCNPFVQQCPPIR